MRDTAEAKIDQEMLIPLMHEQFLVSMARKNGESVFYVKLIFHKGLCMVTMAITIAVNPSHFLKGCSHVGCVWYEEKHLQNNVSYGKMSEFLSYFLVFGKQACEYVMYTSW